MKLVIEIDLGNEAMQSLNDATGAVTDAALRHMDGSSPLTKGEYGFIRDLNGNRVGQWTVKPGDVKRRT